MLSAVDITVAHMFILLPSNWKCEDFEKKSVYCYKRFQGPFVELEP